MAFIACGINHQSASLEVREKFALLIQSNGCFLEKLIDNHALTEAIVLLTCNRAEIFCEYAPSDRERFIAHLANLLQHPKEALEPYLYFHEGTAALHHLIRVASGLDSMMLGEPQILGQLKRAYEQAKDAGAIKKNLHQLFQYVFNAAKRIRTQSGIGKNPISVASIAAQLVCRNFKTLENARVLVIGSGETATLVMKHLEQLGAKHFMIANRTPSRAAHLATRFNGQMLSITDIPLYLAKADIVISATACPLPFINHQLIQHALLERKHAPMFLLDLAIPRDIEANVSELDNVKLYNVDDLHAMVDEGLEERKTAATVAEALIADELHHFEALQRTTIADEVISGYRSYMQNLASQELLRAQQQLSDGKCQHNVLTEFSNRLFNKLTHLPTVGLRKVAADGKTELLDLVHYLISTQPEESTS